MSLLPSGAGCPQAGLIWHFGLLLCSSCNDCSCAGLDQGMVSISLPAAFCLTVCQKVWQSCWPATRCNLKQAELWIFDNKQVQHVLWCMACIATKTPIGKAAKSRLWCRTEPDLIGLDRTTPNSGGKGEVSRPAQARRHCCTTIGIGYPSMAYNSLPDSHELCKSGLLKALIV